MGRITAFSRWVSSSLSTRGSLRSSVVCWATLFVQNPPLQLPKNINILLLQCVLDSFSHWAKSILPAQSTRCHRWCCGAAVRYCKYLQPPFILLSSLSPLTTLPVTAGYNIVMTTPILQFPCHAIRNKVTVAVNFCLYKDQISQMCPSQVFSLGEHVFQAKKGKGNWLFSWCFYPKQLTVD